MNRISSGAWLLCALVSASLLVPAQAQVPSVSIEPTKFKAPKEPWKSEDFGAIGGGPLILHFDKDEYKVASGFFAQLMEEVKVGNNSRKGTPLNLHVIATGVHAEAPRGMEDSLVGLGTAGWVDVEVGVFAQDGHQIFGWATRVKSTRPEANAFGGYQDAAANNFYSILKKKLRN